MKDVKFPIRKVIYSLVIACFSAILVSFASVFAFSFSGFVILFTVYLFSIWKLETKEYIYYYSIRTIRALFFFLPISAIFYSISLTNTMVSSTNDSLSAGATAVGGAIGGFMIIILCLIIGLVGGLIIGAFAKKPDKEQNNGKSIGILFLIILGLSIFYLNQTSEIEKIIKGDDIESSNFISTTNTGTVESSNSKEENDNQTNELQLIDLISFKLTSYNLIEGDYSKSFQFGTEIENKSGKTILGYKGSFEVFDMFDDSLGEFNLDKIGDFNTGAILKEKANYNYNEFMSDNIKLGKAKFEDIKYKYSIDEIIYKDNYNFKDKVFGNNTGKDIDMIEYKLLNKYSKKGDYQNFVEFELDIKNNSIKNIKGIKGSFTIYNIFGKKLGGYEINLTKEIQVGASIKEKIQYSINEFITDEYEIYETNFDLLKYSFNIDNVVYSE